MTTIAIKDTIIPSEILDKWQNVVNIMADVLHVPSAIITRVYPPEIEVLRSARVEGNPYHAGDKVAMARHYCEAVVTQNQTMKIFHAPTDPRWRTAPEIDYGMLAYFGYPLCWPSGHMFGTICVLDKKENRFGALYEKVLFEFKELVELHLSLLEMNEQLKTALTEVKVLRGMLPICSFCKSVRDDTGYWKQIEAYIQERSEAEFSHGLCPTCAKKHYPDLDLYDGPGNPVQ